MKYMDKDGKLRDIQAVWIEDDIPNVYFIDQRYIPFSVNILKSKSVQETVQYINEMVIRGAPSIGAAGAYGMLQSYFQNRKLPTKERNMKIKEDGDLLINSRPTAVDLRNSVNRMRKKIVSKTSDYNLIELEARTIVNEIISECLEIAKKGAALLKDGYNILHHCHTGALATIDVGTALGIVTQAYKNGIKIHVYVDETRPRLQGGRITAWELTQEEVPYTLISDSTAGFLMQQGKIDIIFVGADRVAMNGDIANKIGTYSLAVLANYHNVPFYCAVPWTTFDTTIASGKEIFIEERPPNEVTHALTKDLIRRQITQESKCYNPAFDITPHNLITGIITPYSIITPPFNKKIAKVLENVKKSKHRIT